MATKGENLAHLLQAIADWGHDRQFRDPEPPEVAALDPQVRAEVDALIAAAKRFDR